MVDIMRDHFSGSRSCTVVSTMILEKSDGCAAPVFVATDRLSYISAASFSSPIR
jgi:hypothetical protein